jgi:voltage-gated potassium channel
MLRERQTFRRRLFEILESAAPGDTTRHVFDALMCVLIVSNVLAATVETMGPVYQRYATAFDLFEQFSVMVFTIEYLARLWVCTEQFHPEPVSNARARARFALSPFALIDLIAILPFYLAALFTIDLRFLRIFRLVRILKLARYSPAMESLGRVVYEERRALLGALIIMSGLVLFASSVIYLIEREAQPESFGSIPHAMWWALATLTTVGYGDVTPITPIGRMFGGLVMVFGLAMFALPIAIIASGFATEIHRRDFVVRLGMLSRVPLFSKLDAESISRISTLIRTREVPPNIVLTHAGDRSDSMYFILSGQVALDLPSGRVTLEDGDFFGEIGLLRDTVRSATVTTLKPCRLMMLEVADFHLLIEQSPELKRELEEVAQQLHGAVTAGGDIASVEIDESPPR